MALGGLVKDSWATYAVAKAARGVKMSRRRRDDFEYVEKQPPLLKVIRESWKAGQEEARIAHLEKLVEKHGTRRGA